MKLNYGEAQSGSQVLRKGAHRIELHVVRLENELFALLMFSGPDNELADRNKQQGPYHSKGQAQGALNAITHELKALGYDLESEPLIWQVQAQAALKMMRETRHDNSTDSTFTPLGIIPEED